MIVVVNYGIGNLDSVVRAFRACDAEAVVSSRAEDLERADGIVLPGVGSFGQAMRNLTNAGLVPLLNERVLDRKTPTLGICLGFQMFTRRSDEGNAAGLGWIDGETRHFRDWAPGEALKVPHLGWNDVIVRKESPLMRGIASSATFYFAHSYCVRCQDEDAVLGVTEYGGPFVSAVQKGNIFGTQFHPEKSHAAGLTLVRNFVEYCQRHA